MSRVLGKVFQLAFVVLFMTGISWTTHAASYNGQTETVDGSSLHNQSVYITNNSNITVNGAIDTGSNSYIVVQNSVAKFVGRVQTYYLDIDGKSTVVFEDEVITDHFEIMNDVGAEKAPNTMFRGDVTALCLAIDTMRNDTSSTNTFEGTLTLSGYDQDIKDFSGKEVSLVVADGINIFDGNVSTGGAGAVFINSTSTFNGDLDATGGEISIGYGDLAKAGENIDKVPGFYNHPATVILNGSSSAATVDVFEKGFLQLGSSSSLSATTVNVFENGFLQLGIGSSLSASSGITIGNKGTLALTGSATITGSILFKRGSVLETGLDTLNITGSATIENGAKASFAQSGLTPEQILGKTILTATSGLPGTGMFSSPLLRFIKDGNSIKVAGIRSTSEAVADVMGSRAYSENNRNVAMLYDKVMNDATVSDSLRSSMLSALEQSLDLTESNGAAGNAVFNQLFGLDAIHSTVATRTTGQRFSGEVSGRLSRLRDTRAMADSGVRSDSAFANPEFGCYQDNSNRIWAGGFGTWIRQNDRGGTYGYKYNSGGFILGYDYSIDDFTFGFSGAYSNGSFKNNDGISKSDVDTMNFGLYGSYDPDCGFYADLNLGYGQMWDKERGSFISGGDLVTTSVKFHNHAFQADAHIGYAFKIPGEVRIVPTVGVEYMLIHQKSTTKHSNDPAYSNWFGSRNTSYIDIPVGMKIARTWSLGGGASITPEVHGAWVYQAGNSRPKLQMGYVGSSSSTIIYGIESGRSHGLVGAGVKANFNRYVDAFAIYNFEFRSGYKNHNILAGLGLSF